MLDANHRAADLLGEVGRANPLASWRIGREVVAQEGGKLLMDQLRNTVRCVRGIREICPTLLPGGCQDQAGRWTLRE